MHSSGLVPRAGSTALLGWRRRPLARTLGVLWFAALSACSRSEAPKAEPTPAAPTVEAPAARTPNIEDTTFKLALVGEPAYTANQPSQVELTLDARGGYHVNLDYPIRVELQAPGLKLTKSALARGDAAELSEQRARFALPFTAEAGVHELTANVDFAVCTKETCVPDQRSVTFPVTVR